MQDLIDKTFSDSTEMRYFDHSLFLLAQEKGNLESEDYKQALFEMLRLSRQEGIVRFMNEYDLEAKIGPSSGPACKTDLTNGDNFSIESSSPAAIAGYLSINVLMGQIDGLLVGISIFDRAWSEPVLLEIAYNYEQGTQQRFTPNYSTGNN